MTGNPGDSTYDPTTQGIPVNVLGDTQNWATDTTVPAGTTFLIAANGPDYVCGNMTINGTLINSGTLRCKSVTMGKGGVYVAEAGSKIEIYNLY